MGVKHTPFIIVYSSDESLVTEEGVCCVLMGVIVAARMCKCVGYSTG